MEAIPPAVLPVDLIHRAVRRLFEPEGGEPPAAPTIRFVNLSIGDPARPLMREMSSWARLVELVVVEVPDSVHRQRRKSSTGHRVGSPTSLARSPFS